MLYSAKVIDHFMNPRNVGIMEDADGVGQVGSARCGDTMKIYLKIQDGIITRATFETFGCGTAIASSSMATVLITGKPLSQALALTNQAVAEALDGLPEQSCTALCWQSRQSVPRSGTTTTAATFPMIRQIFRCMKNRKIQTVHFRCAVFLRFPDFSNIFVGDKTEYHFLLKILKFCC